MIQTVSLNCAFESTFVPKLSHFFDNIFFIDNHIHAEEKSTSDIFEKRSCRKGLIAQDFSKCAKKFPLNHTDHRQRRLQVDVVIEKRKKKKEKKKRKEKSNNMKSRAEFPGAHLNLLFAIVL